MNRGSARDFSSVCYVRQSGKPKEPRLNPTVLRRVHLRLTVRPRGSVFTNNIVILSVAKDLLFARSTNVPPVC